MNRRWRAGSWRRCLTALIAVVLVSSGCGGTSDANAPQLSVVATMWPLAQMVSMIGGDKVTVTDLTTPGTNPRQAPVNPVVQAQLGQAAFIVEVGDGYQPALEAAIAGAGHHARVLALHPAVGGPSPALWLDPPLMTKAVQAVTDTLAQLNPAAAVSYRNGARDFDQTLRSLDIDYRSTLSGCVHPTLVTADDTFAGLAARYALVNKPINPEPSATPNAAAPPDAAAVDGAVSTIRASGAGTVFDETLADNRLIDAAASAAGVHRKTLDTLSGPPPGGWPSGADYFSLMESNLAQLTNALKCPSE